MRTGESLQLRLVHCDYEEIESDLELPVPPTMATDCEVTPLDVLSSGNWSVNGAVGGSGKFGSVVGDADRWNCIQTTSKPFDIQTNARFPLTSIK